MNDQLRYTSNDDLSVGTHTQECSTNTEDGVQNVTKSLQNLRTAARTDVGDVKRRWEEFLTEPQTTMGSEVVGDTHKSIQFKSQVDLESTEEEVIIYNDEAVDIQEIGGGNSTATEAPPRLLMVSSKVRNSVAMRGAILPNVIFVQYKYDSMDLDGVLTLVTQTLSTRKVDSIAIVMSCVGSSIQISGKDEKVITKETIAESQPIREFFTNLVDHIDTESETNRLDFFACSSVLHTDSSAIIKEIQSLIEIPVGMARDFIGTDLTQKNNEVNTKSQVNFGELYFKIEKLRGWSGQNQQTLAGFEKIQTVGKGAYGAAVLYRKKDDESLVILKEINMHDLNASERQLALNEVSILAMLDHPNIISYYDSFEEDGVLMIEIEYADGGTLAQHLSHLENPLEEKEVLLLFQQIVAAIRHIHELNILHRDLKTANIFLTKEGIVKVGDFGISKMMSSANKGANTVLGTPYYISPEMCEGKPYNDKSDMWALGCILYEIACLQKTFEGSNLPALVNKIMRGQFAPVKGNYSQEFKDLIMDMLKQNPDERPSANELMYTRIPELLNKFEDPPTDCEDDLQNSHGSLGDKSKKKTRSLLYYFVSSTASLSPVELPPKIKIRQVAVGEDHVIVVTTERQVFTWGEGSKGQLGHGNSESLAKPTLVESLKGKSISRACCGDGFSVFASDNGIVLTCGDGSHGCLGHGDWSSVYRPRLIEPLLSVDVISVACGPKHVAVVGSDGDIFTWGHGGDGRLGHGTEDDVCTPTQVNITEPAVIRSVRCGHDGTMFLTDVGSVLACGSNADNKLGLNNRQGFIMAMKNIFTKTEVDGSNVPLPVRALTKHRVVDISMGPYHSAVIIEPGHIYMFGRNSEGQLGIGNTKPNCAPVEVKSLLEDTVNRVQCGEHYSVCSTASNELYYWGLRFKPPPQLTDDNNDSRSSSYSTINKEDIRLESITPRKSTQTHSRQNSLTSVTSITSKKGTHSRQSSVTSVTSITGVKDTLNLTHDSSLLPGSVNSEHDGYHDSTKVSPTHQRQASVDNSKFSPTHQSQQSVDSAKLSPSHQRQTSLDSAFSANLTDSGCPTSNTNTPTENLNAGSAGFRPLSNFPRRTASASSRENSKEKEKEETSKDDSEIIYPPMHLMKISKSGEESLTISGFYCHGENIFLQLETTAPPPRKRSRRKRLKKRFSNTLAVPQGKPLLYSASSREGGDEYSSEASELEMRTEVPTWLRQELALSVTEDNDGNEADDTSGGSDTEIRSSLIDNSMSSIQINKELTPVKTEKKPSPRVKQKDKVKDNMVSKVGYGDTHGRSLSTNSTESELEYPSGDFQSDSSSKDAANLKVLDPSGAMKKALQVCAPRKMTAPSGYRNRLPPGPHKTSNRNGGSHGKMKGNDMALKEQIAARGFVSDVTVKRREEALLNELELTREEKKEAEARLWQLEELHREQEESLRREAESKAKEREKSLEEQINSLKQELQFQNSQLQNNQRLVMSLQEELNKVQTKKNKRSTTSMGSKTPGTNKNSTVCCLQ